MTLSAEMKERVRVYAGDYIGENAQFVEGVGYTVNWNGKRYHNVEISFLADEVSALMEESEFLIKTLEALPDAKPPVHHVIRVIAKDQWIYMRLLIAAEILEATGMCNDFYENRHEHLSIEFETDEQEQFDKLMEIIGESEISAFENCRIMYKKDVE